MTKNQLFNKQCLNRQFTPQPQKRIDSGLQQIIVKVSASQDRTIKRIDSINRNSSTKYQNTRVKAILQKNYFSEFPSAQSVDSLRIADCLKTQNFSEINATARNALFLRQKKKKILNLLQESRVRKVKRNFQVVHSQKQLHHIKNPHQKKIGIRTKTSNPPPMFQNTQKLINYNRNHNKLAEIAIAPHKIKFQPVPEDRITFITRRKQQQLNFQNNESRYSQLKEVLAESYGAFLCSKGKFDMLHDKKSKKTSQVASLTKIMTSVLVLSIARKFNLKINVQTVRVGHKAAGLQGTTANLLYGDHLTIYDALHGLMLPSGNDAAQALAEWGGKRIRYECNKYFTKFFDQIGKKKSSPLKFMNKMANNDNISYSSLFIYHMNQLAKSLKMTNTKFNNPHGLMDKNNFSCAYDIAILSHYAVQNFPEFLNIVQTMSYKTKIYNKTFGSQRDVVWNNTHKLLKVPGVKGIKTGITPSAGPCLSTFFDLGFGQYLLVIVLKAKSQEHRFLQTKRLIIYTLQRIGRPDLLSAIQAFEQSSKNKQQTSLKNKQEMKLNKNKNLTSISDEKAKIKSINNKIIQITLKTHSVCNPNSQKQFNPNNPKYFNTNNSKQQREDNTFEQDINNIQLSQEFMDEIQSQSQDS